MSALTSSSHRIFEPNIKIDYIIKLGSFPFCLRLFDLPVGPYCVVPLWSFNVSFRVAA
jgi:hypothetical protein